MIKFSENGQTIKKSKIVEYWGKKIKLLKNIEKVEKNTKKKLNC